MVHWHNLTSIRFYCIGVGFLATGGGQSGSCLPETEIVLLSPGRQNRTVDQYITRLLTFVILCHFLYSVQVYILASIVN